MYKVIETWDKKELAVLLVLGSYMFQGVATLIYQVSWEQAMEKMVGMALPTSAVVVSMFLLGMASGAYIFGKLSISARWAGKIFVINQFFAALFGFLYVCTDGLKFLLYLTTDSEQWLTAVYLLRLFLASLFLFAPAFFIGAAFPLLNRCEILLSLRNRAERLYLVNLLGSIIGALMAGFILLPNYGLMPSVLFAVLLNICIVPIFLFSEKMCVLEPGSEEPVSNSGSSEALQSLETSELINNSQSLLLLTILAAPFFNTLLELLFVRLLVLFMGASVFAFSIVGAVLLIALLSGAFLVHFIYRAQIEKFWRLAFLLYLISALWLLAELIFLPSSSAFISSLNSICADSFSGIQPLSIFFRHLVFLMILMFVPCLCLGAILPLYFRLPKKLIESASIKFSQAYALNLFASVFGCLSGGILVFPILSGVSDHSIYLAFSLTAIALLSVSLLLYVFGVIPEKTNKIICLGVGSLTIMLLFLIYMTLSLKPLIESAADLRFYREGVNSTVSLLANVKDNLVRLQTDGQTEASLPLNKKLPTVLSDQTTQTLLGILPGLFSVRKGKKIFLLGFGSGVTAKSLLANPEVTNVTAAELEPAVIEAAKNLQCYAADERLKIYLLDGRIMLSMFERNYDVIISQAGEPWRSSSKYLYTLEFWQLAKSRLNNNGIFCQWIPMYGLDKNNLLVLYRTFISVFPDTFVIKENNSGDLILLAFNLDPSKENDKYKLFAEIVEKAAQRIQITEIRRNLIQCGFDNLSDVVNHFKLGLANFDNCSGQLKSPVAQIALNRDDFPFVQYQSGSFVLKKGMRINFDIEECLPIVSDPVFLAYQLDLSKQKSFKLSDISICLDKVKKAIVSKDFVLAMANLKEVLEKQTNNFEARFTLGKILCYLGDEKEGLEQIKWASRVDVRSILPNLYVTLFYGFRGDWQLADANLLLLEKKSSGDHNISYLAKKIRSRQKLAKENSAIRILMFKCHYPI